jgi:DNA polymerase III delta subunit
MLFLLYGKNDSLIERTVVEISRKYPNTERIHLNAKDITPNKFADIANTFDLLQQAPLITLRFDRTVTADPFYDVVSQISPQTHVIFIFPFDLSPSHVFIKNPKSVKIISGGLSLKTVADVFKFTDYLFSGRRTDAYKELYGLLSEGNDGFYILSMCLYSLRNIFNVAFSSPELAGMKDFPKRKAMKYAKVFTRDDIIGLFSYFYDIDKRCKIGLLDIHTALCLVCEKILAYTKS